MTDETKSLADEPDAPAIGDNNSVDANQSEDQPNAVLILRSEDESGISTDVFPMGDVKPTEVATIIELGMKSWRQKIGL